MFSINLLPDIWTSFAVLFIGGLLLIKAFFVEPNADKLGATLAQEASFILKQQEETAINEDTKGLLPQIIEISSPNTIKDGLKTDLGVNSKSILKKTQGFGMTEYLFIQQAI